MDTPVADINQRIAAQVRELRRRRGLSLEAVAAGSGVSRSMISLIERAEANPSAVVLERLAFALGVPLARLFDAPLAPDAVPQPWVRRAEQTEWRDPASGYLRRNLSPPHWPSPIRMVAVDFPAGARVAYETGVREPVVQQQVWVQKGALSVTWGETEFPLQAGDCLAMRLDRPIVFANQSKAPARYLVVTSTDSARPPASP